MSDPPALRLRAWQEIALKRWTDGGHRGIVSVVTGGGKTIFALACVRALAPRTVLVTVPTQSLLDQWWEECAAFFGLSLDEINVLTTRSRMRSGTINLCVVNTAAQLAEQGRTVDCMLIVDECHKAASPVFRKVFELPTIATLGLSATPERQYDDGLNQVLVPALGPVIFTYSYREALQDGVIVPFRLRNVVFDLEEERQAEYDALTKKIAKSIARNGMEHEATIALLLRRARVLNLSMVRIRLTLKLVARHRRSRVLVFHEDINACNVIGEVLSENGVSAAVYHSRLKLKDRARALAAFRGGQVQVLVTCRALDEGFNVPETEVGIIAASTATSRQRIQRLGRVLRPSKGKESALVYTLVATAPEVQRLKQEEENLEGVANVDWARA